MLRQELLNIIVSIPKLIADLMKRQQAIVTILFKKFVLNT